MILTNQELQSEAADVMDREGLRQKDIADAMGVSASIVSRSLKSGSHAAAYSGVLRFILEEYDNRIVTTRRVQEHHIEEAPSHT